jgi:hypothetical protein
MIIFREDENTETSRLTLFTWSSPLALPYKQLQNEFVRLVKVRPGGFYDPCEILEVNLNLQQEYVTLSYVWGDPRSTVDIKLHGRVISSRNYSNIGERLKRAGQKMRLCLELN